MLVLLFASHSIAGEVSWVPPSTVQWKGDLDQPTLRKFRKILEEQPVSQLAFVDSSGGMKLVAEGLIDDIVENDLSTSAQGVCNSGCALAFLAGKRRSLLPSEPERVTKIGIHGSFHKGSMKSVAPTEKEITFLIAATNGKMPRNFVELALNTKSAQGGLMVYERPIKTSAGEFQVLFCDAIGENSSFACIPIPSENPISLGVISQEHSEPISIEAKPAVAPAK